MSELLDNFALKLDYDIPKDFLGNGSFQGIGKQLFTSRYHMYQSHKLACV